MTSDVAPDALWTLRHRIYDGIARAGVPPSLPELAAGMDLPEDDTLALLHALEDRHAVLLTEDRRGVLLANPFSAIPTPYRVTAGEVAYWANCAWDMLGVPAALHTDADIHATYAADGAPATLAVRDGAVSGAGGIVHFLKPFRTWYDDLRHT